MNIKITNKSPLHAQFVINQNKINFLISNFKIFKHPRYGQIDFAKNLYTFDYLGTENHNFDKNEFYLKCKEDYDNNLEDIKILVRAISDFDNRN